MLCAICREDLDADFFAPKDYTHARIHCNIPRCLDCIALSKPERLQRTKAALAKITPEAKVVRRKARREKAKKLAKEKTWESMSRGERRDALLARRPPSELLLEAELRKRKMDFEAQVWVQGFWIDFKVGSRKLGIEVDGGYHFTDEQKQKDAERTQVLEGLGWTILRFKNEDVRDNLSGVLYAITLELLKVPQMSRKKRNALCTMTGITVIPPRALNV